MERKIEDDGRWGDKSIVWEDGSWGGEIRGKKRRWGVDESRKESR
jgi:hypothetical protein